MPDCCVIIILYNYSTSGGVLKHSDGRTVTAPTIMWVKVSVLIIMRIISLFHYQGIRLVVKKIKRSKFSVWKCGCNIRKWAATWIRLLEEGF